MKSGRKAYSYAQAKASEHVPGYLRGLKGAELDALVVYAGGVTASAERDEILAQALIEAANRYLVRARKKAAKLVRRAKLVL